MKVGWRNGKVVYGKQGQAEESLGQVRLEMFLEWREFWHQESEAKETVKREDKY